VKKLVTLSLVILLVGISRSSLADDGTQNKTDQLFPKGISLQATTTTDFAANVSGGFSRKSTLLENVDLILNIDTKKAGLWEDGKFKFYGLYDAGGSIAALTGAMQVNSNIDAPTTAKLYEAYYEHEFFNGELRALAGLHNFNSEFYVSEYAGLFLNASFGIGQDASQVGPSIFPTSALAFRLRGQLSERLYALFGIYDGIPGKPNNNNGTHIILNKNDGVYCATEVGLHSTEEESADNLYKLSLGAWRRSTDFTDYNNVERKNNTGFYGTADKSIFREEDKAQGLGAFFQLGYAPGDKNQTEHYYGAGLQYTGLLPGRDQDVTGLAWARAENSGDFRSANPGTTTAETILELTYRAPVLSWLTLQPDIQYVITPGTNQGVDNALVMIMRVQASLSE